MRYFLLYALFGDALHKTISVEFDKECRQGADSSLHAGEPTECNAGTIFIGKDSQRATQAPGCCERPNSVPEIEAQVLSYLLRSPGGNCEVIGTCALQNETGVPGVMEVYDPTRAPADDDIYPGNETTGTSVEVSIMLINIGIPSRQTKGVNIKFYFKQYWNDPRLRWSSRTFAHHTAPRGLERVSHVPSSTIWTPDTFFSRLSAETHDEVVEIDSAGNVYFVQEMTGSLQCDIDFHYFPYDNPICWTDIQSFGQQKQVVQYRTGILPSNLLDALEVPAYPGLGDYRLVDAKFFDVLVTDRMGKWDETQGDRSQVGSYAMLPGIVWTLTLEHSKETAFNNYIFQPWVTVTLLSCGANFINPGAAPARVAGTIIPILQLFAIVSKTNESMPPTPYVSALHVYLLVCIVVCSLNFLEFAVVNFLTARIEAKWAAMQAAQKQSPSHTLYEAMVGVGYDNKHVFRALRKIRTQEDWTHVQEEFRENYPLFYGGDVCEALRKDLHRKDFEECQKILQAKGITFEGPAHSSFVAPEVLSGFLEVFGSTKSGAVTPSPTATQATSVDVDSGGWTADQPLQPPNVVTAQKSEAPTEYVARRQENWKQFLRAVETRESVSLSDLVALPVEEVRELVAAYAPANRLEKAQVMIEWHRQVRLQQNLKAEMNKKGSSASCGGGDQTHEQPEIRFGRCVVSRMTPARVESFWRQFAPIFFNLFSICWLITTKILASGVDAPDLVCRKEVVDASSLVAAGNKPPTCAL